MTRITKLLFLLLLFPLLLAGCGEDANEPAIYPEPTVLSPAQDASIREGSDLVIEVADLDSAREVKVFYRFEGAVYYHPVEDKTSIRIVHKITGLPFGQYKVDIGVQHTDATNVIVDTRRFEYIP